MESIYFEINKCLSDCESDENIEKMLSVTWVNVYNLVEQISFKSKYNQKDNDNELTIITPQLTNQVKISVNYFKYQNIKLRKNIVQIPKGRFTFLFDYFIKQQEYIFYNFNPQTSFDIHFIPYRETQIVSEDGKNYYTLNKL